MNQNPLYYLAIDLGNTAIKLGVFHGSDPQKFPPEIEKIILPILDTHQLENAKTKLQHLLKQYFFEQIIFCSVAANQIEQSIKKILPNNILEIQNLKFPFPIHYYPTSSLGKDRLSNAVAAYFLYPNQKTMIIDIGTCIKYDLVSPEGFEGGYISPGYQMRFRALNQFTGALPLLQVENLTEPSKVLPTSTEQAMLNGVYWGVWAEIQSQIKFFFDKKGAKILVFTGGELKYFENSIKSIIFAKIEKHLTLLGLYKMIFLNHE